MPRPDCSASKAVSDFPDLDVAFPVPPKNFPDNRENVPCYFAQANLVQRTDNT